MEELKHVKNYYLIKKVNSYYATNYSEDNRISITSSDGVYTMELHMVRDNIWPVFSMKKFFIPCSTYNSGADLNLKVSDFCDKLPQYKLYESILRTDLGTDGGILTPMEPKALKSLFSPVIFPAERCALAVLSSMGGLHIYVRIVERTFGETHKCLGNVTKQYVDSLRPGWTDVRGKSPEEQFEELIRRSESIKPTDFTWSDAFNDGDGKYCLIIVGHYNGDITFWKVSSRDYGAADATLKLIKKYSSGLSLVSSLHWKYSNGFGMLTIGNVYGKLNAIPISIDGDNGMQVQETAVAVLYEDEDEMEVQYVNTFQKDNFLFVIVIKGTFLIIYLINDEAEILDICHFQTGSVIADIKLVKDRIYLLNYCGLFRELILTPQEGKVSISWKLVHVNLNWSIRKAQGFVVSPNGAFVAFLTSLCKLSLECKDGTKSHMISFFLNKAVNPVDLILKAPNLSNHWDCLETLRLSSLLEKEIPSDLEMNYDEFPLGKLKKYAVIAKISEITYEQLHNLENRQIQPFSYVMKLINLKLAVYRMQDLLKAYFSGKELSVFQLRSLDVLNSFLKNAVLSDSSLEGNSNLVEEMLDVVSRANLVVYPEQTDCYFCKQKITGCECVPHHYETRCAISMMPMDSFKGFSCPLCKCRVHQEVEKEYELLCPYCDVPLELIEIKRILDGRA